jgi:uncharacterized membrane protein YhaH (DUF805 family)
MQKSFDFSGRASRSEFWKFIFFISVIHSILFNWFSQQPGTLSLHFGFNLNLHTEAPWWTNIYAAVFTLPFVSALVRRAHDLDIDGSKIFISLFIAVVALIFGLKLSASQGMATAVAVGILICLFGLFLFLTLKKSDPNPNKFGPNPHEVPS